MAAKLTICMTVYNEGEDVGNVLECILAQDYSDFSLNIIDNASTDGTVDICREYERYDARVDLSVNEYNVGPIQNFHRCLWRAKTPFLQLHSANDRTEPWQLGMLVSALEQDPDAGLAYPTHVDRLPAYPHLVDDDPVQRVHRLMTEFQSGHMLYGVFRRRIVDMCSPVPYRMCADQIYLSEVAIYAKILCVNSDSYHRKNHARPTPLVALLCSNYWPRRLEEPPEFSEETGIYTPYLDGFVGYLEMIDCARISSSLKTHIKQVAHAVYVSRWSKHMSGEREQLLEHAGNFLAKLKLRTIPVTDNAFAAKLLDALIRMRILVPPQRRHDRMIKELAKIVLDLQV